MKKSEKHTAGFLLRLTKARRNQINMIARVEELSSQAWIRRIIDRELEALKQRNQSGDTKDQLLSAILIAYEEETENGSSDIE